jgi:carbamoyltransferase
MKILGISLGHDSNFCLLEDGKIARVMEAERYFRQKRYKLSAQTLSPGKVANTYQYTDIEDLKMFLERVKIEWGSSFDALAVQNQGRVEEYDNLLIVLSEAGITFKEAHHVNHHLSHAALSYFTSPFTESLILSYDGIGNDGKTVFFSAKDNKIEYANKVPLSLGQSYNNLGYIIGIKPEIEGTTSGKVMGLTSYGTVQKSWIPYAQTYISKYKKFPTEKIEGLATYGKGHRINSVGLEDIPELQKYIVPREIPFEMRSKDSIKERGVNWKNWFKLMFGFIKQTELRLPGPKDKDSQNLAATVQEVWTQEVLRLLKENKKAHVNLCLSGGCALNGTTNYAIEKSGEFKKVHFIPNPSDCGLASGAALYVYYTIQDHPFSGLNTFYSPYLGSLPYDNDKLPELAQKYPHKEILEKDLPRVLAEYVSKDLIVGLIRDGYEVGPRALGNRSIICNPVNKNMREILNDKVKHREWYRPFAPMVTEEDSETYFTNTDTVPYMSVICYTKEEYRDKLPSITHVDGTARIQTVNKEQNPLIYHSLKEFEKLSGMPIFLNTSFNPAGEPILNFNEVALNMLDTTDMDLVIIGSTVYTKPGKEALLS